VAALTVPAVPVDAPAGAPLAAMATLPPPLVKLTKHPVRWVRVKLELLGSAVVLGHVGALVAVGLYFLVFEVDASMTHWWHQVVSNSDLRHSIRDVAEGVFGGLLAQAMVWNHYKHRRSGWFDRAEQALHLPPVLAAPFFALLYGAVGFVAAYFALRAVGAHAAAASANSAWWARIERIWTSDWDKKIVGLVASFAARRPMRPIYDGAQLWFAERRYARHQGPRWYHPPTFRARLNDLHSSGTATARHGRLQSVLVLAAVGIGVGLAGYGVYVLVFVARGR
jgi:hypothetical protein